MCILIGLTSSTIYNNDKKVDISYYPIEVVNGDESKVQQRLNSNQQNFFIKKDSVNIIKLIGVKGKFGFTEPLHESNNFINTTLYLWGNEGEILNKKLKITAVNDNGERIEISNLYEVTKDGHGEMVEKNILSTARENLSISIPQNGIWTFDIYLDEVLYGSAVININNSKVLMPL